MYCIKSLLTVNLKSNCFDEKIDAIKHLGLLKVGDSAAIYALNQILNDPNENELMRFETAKSLVLLGIWNENVCKFFIKHLKSNLLSVKVDILKSILNGKNVLFTDKVSVNNMSYILILEILFC